MLCSDLTLSKRVASYSDVDRLSQGVDLDRRLAGSGNRNVSGGGEKRLDLYHGTANTHSVEQFARQWHGDGGEYAQDGDSDRELDYGECVSCQCLSFRRVSWLDSISWKYFIRLSRIIRPYSSRSVAM
jgi:hypothetical protein